MMHHEMWQQSRHFGLGAGPGYPNHSHYLTPPPPPREYTEFPHFEGEVINIDSQNARGTDIRAVESMASLEESVTPGMTDVPKDSKDGANEGISGGSKQGKSPNIKDYFPMSRRGL